jgi:rare lipoprotein A
VILRGIIFSVLLILGACATQSVKTYYERGLASWYGPHFQKRRTANGERFDMKKLTAAHRTLPFGTLVKVKDLRTAKEVTVRINDRGPYSVGRIIDLSKEAARRLDMLAAGADDVELSIVK